MAMAPQGQPNSSATNRPWEPYSHAGDFARHMALYLIILLGVLGLAIVLEDAVRYFLGRCHRARRVHAGSGSGTQDTDRDNNADSDPENPAVEAPPPPPPPALVYSAAECIICLGEFEDGDAVRVLAACGHRFHESCIEGWLAGDRHSSCPTYLASAAVATAPATAAAAAAPQPDDEAANRREPNSGAGHYDARYVAFFIVGALVMIAIVVTLLDATVHSSREGK